MPTHAELAGKLLKDAATFFRNIAEENQAVAQDMRTNAGVFEQLADLLLASPTGSTGGETHASMAARLMTDCAGFFRTLAQDNEPIRDQMMENARVFEEIAGLLAHNPLGILD